MEMTVSKDRMQVVEQSYLSILGFGKNLDAQLGKDWRFKCRRNNGEISVEEVLQYNEIIYSTCMDQIVRYILLKMDIETMRLEKIRLLYMNFSKLYEVIETEIGKEMMLKLKQNRPDCREEICKYNLALKKFFQEKIVEFTI